jgi:hypothetical protein
MIKAVFFDIDGTLLSHRLGGVPQDTKEALRSLQEKGILVFTSTGRHIQELDNLPLQGIDFDGYVLLNGQLCLDKNRGILCESAIASEDIGRAQKMFEEKEVPIAFVEKDRTYVNFIDERVQKAQKEISSPLPPVGNYEGGKVYLVNVFSPDEEANMVLKQMPHCKMTRWNDNGVDIISQSGGKVEGIKQVLSIYGIRQEEIMAFGDGENDMDMLQFAGTGIAMGNAEEGVKACADYVTGDIDAGGVADALRYYGVI